MTTGNSAIMLNDNDKKPTRQEVLVNFRRNEILGAVRAIARKDGLDSLTMERVAEVAGMGKGTIYTYFKDKAELICAELETSHKEMIARIEQIISETETIPGRLKKLVEILLAITENSRHFIDFIHQPANRMICLSAGNKKSQFFTEFVNTVSKIFSEGAIRAGIRENSPTALSLMLLGMLSSIFRITESFSELDKERYAYDTIDVFLHGISRRGDIKDA